MAYLGNDLQVAFPSYRLIDDISASFNGVLKTFALTIGGASPVPFPINPQQCLISVNGTIQKPDPTGVAGFTLTGTNIVFASAPTGGWAFFGVILAGADYVNIGANFPDGQVNAPSITFDQDTDTGFYRSSSGAISFASNGVGTATFGSASFIAPSFIPTSSTVPTNGVYLPAANSVAISTNGTGRLFVNSSGSVGIGTSTVNDRLEVNGVVRSAFGANTINTIQGAYRFNNPIYPNQFAAIYGYTTGSSVDQIEIAFLTSGSSGVPTERMRLTQTGLGIGTTSPSNALHINSGATGTSAKFESTGSGSYLNITNSSGAWSLGATTTSFILENSGGEALRVDSSRRLLIGTSSARNLGGIGTCQFTLEGTGYNSSSVAFVNNENSVQPPYLILGKSRGGSVGSSTIVQSGDSIGQIVFAGADGTDIDTRAAEIVCTVDGTPGANDMPGRLVFSTTADGASTPTERVRITNAGFLKVSNTGTYNDVSAAGTYSEVMSNIASLPALTIASRTTSFISDVLSQGCFRSASTAFSCAKFFSGDGGTNAYSDTEFNFRGDGNAFADGSWTGGGADYAEYFEWSDSNPDAEDRRGISVVLDGDKIREANVGEDPIGVISGNPSVVGDAAWNKWSGKHLRDEFGTYIQEDYEVEDEDGNTVVQQRRKLNPAYDPEVGYISREQRPEWDCVGLMGKLRIRKGQVTGSRWIKMRDISDSIEEWLVR